MCSKNVICSKIWTIYINNFIFYKIILQYKITKGVLTTRPKVKKIFVVLKYAKDFG